MLDTQESGLGGSSIDPSDHDHVHPMKIFDIAKAEGRPVYASAPMVRYSKLAFRQTVKDYGVDLCWTPMILAKEFNRSVIARDSEYTPTLAVIETHQITSGAYSHPDFTLSPTPFNIPTIIQFGASSPLEFSRASRTMAPHISGVDLNCGCPQSWACAESMGASLMGKRELVAQIVREAKAALHRDGFGASRTVSVKIRIHKDPRETLDFIRTVEDAGVDFITIHARTKSQRSSTPPNLETLALLTSHARVPVIANGDVSTLSAAASISAQTGVAGVMTARALLQNPALFAGFDSCPWEAVERFLSYVARAPLPFKLVVHHLGEMVGSGGHGEGGGEGVSGALIGKAERAGLVACANMVELIDWLDGVREVRRL